MVYPCNRILLCPEEEGNSDICLCGRILWQSACGPYKALSLPARLKEGRRETGERPCAKLRTARASGKPASRLSQLPGRSFSAHLPALCAPASPHTSVLSSQLQTHTGHTAQGLSLRSLPASLGVLEGRPPRTLAKPTQLPLAPHKGSWVSFLE